MTLTPSVVCIFRSCYQYNIYSIYPTQIGLPNTRRRIYVSATLKEIDECESKETKSLCLKSVRFETAKFMTMTINYWLYCSEYAHNVHIPAQFTFNLHSRKRKRKWVLCCKDMQEREEWQPMIKESCSDDQVKVIGDEDVVTAEDAEDDYNRYLEQMRRAQKSQKIKERKASSRFTVYVTEKDKEHALNYWDERDKYFVRPYFETFKTEIIGKISIGALRIHPQSQ